MAKRKTVHHHTALSRQQALALRAAGRRMPISAITLEGLRRRVTARAAALARLQTFVAQWCVTYGSEVPIAQLTNQDLECLLNHLDAWLPSGMARISIVTPNG